MAKIITIIIYLYITYENKVTKNFTEPQKWKSHKNKVQINASACLFFRAAYFFVMDVFSVHINLFTIPS